MPYQGLSELIADNTSSIERTILLNSSYLVPRAGLESTSIQAGDAISVSAMPVTSLKEGVTLVIRFDEIDLQFANGKGDATDLSVYKWDNYTWTIVGGTPDTVRNMITVKINAPGVYAAFTSQVVTGVNKGEPGNLIPYQFELQQNYPNPFSPATTIEYNISRSSHVTLEIYNILGQKVKTLVDWEEAAGSYKIIWDGTTESGESVSPGTYLYRFRADEFVETKNMILLK